MKLSEFLSRKGIVKEIDLDQYAIDVHLAIIEKYGWIPLEDYKKIPIPMVLAMLDRMEKEYNEMEKQKGKMKRR